MNIVIVFIAMCVAIGIVLVGFFLLVTINFLKFFYWHKCKHCHHTMNYKGLKEDDNNGHYLFHCPKCGAWEQIPREEFIHSCDKDCNPNEL